MGCPFVPTEPPVESCRRCTESPHPWGKALGCPGGCPERKGRDGSRKAVVKVTQMPCSDASEGGRELWRNCSPGNVILVALAP